MKSIYLDDNRPAPEGWVLARNAEEVMLALLTGGVDRLSLDFDLDQPPCQTCQDTCGLREQGCQRGCKCHAANGGINGMEVLEWMRDMGRWPRQKPLVHSANTEQAPKMQAFIDQFFPGDT